MTQSEMLSLYADAKEHVEVQLPTRSRPRTKWRVKKYLPAGLSFDDFEGSSKPMGLKPLKEMVSDFPETKGRWLHNRGGWIYTLKAEVADILANYGLTVEQFITAAIQTFWLDFETRCGDTEHNYLKQRFPYAF